MIEFASSMPSPVDVIGFGSYLREFCCMEELYGDGYTYLALFDATYRPMVKALCRSYPTLDTLMMLDAVLYSSRIWGDLHVVCDGDKLHFCDDARDGAVSWAEVVLSKLDYDGIIPDGWKRHLQCVSQVGCIDHWYRMPVTGVATADSTLVVGSVETNVLSGIDCVVMNVEVVKEVPQQNRVVAVLSIGDVQEDSWYGVIVPDLPVDEVQLDVPDLLEMRDIFGRRYVGLSTVRVGQKFILKSAVTFDVFRLTFQWDLHSTQPRWGDYDLARELRDDSGLSLSSYSCHNFPNGYCYLSLIKPELRSRVAQIKGGFPSLGSLTSLSFEYFLSDIGDIAYDVSCGRLHLYTDAHNGKRFRHVWEQILRNDEVSDHADWIDLGRESIAMSTLVGGRVGPVVAGSGVAAVVGSAVRDIQTSSVVETAATMSVSTIIAIIEGILLFIIGAVFVFKTCVSGGGSGGRRRY